MAACFYIIARTLDLYKMAPFRDDDYRRHSSWGLSPPPLRKVSALLSHTLPKLLTAQEWNAKKGVIAKMAGETGMGAALVKLKTEWDKIPWDKIDPDEALLTHVKGKPTLAALNSLKPAAKEAIPKIAPARTQLKAVRDLAQATEVKWKANKLVPSSSRAYVGTIKTEAERLSIALKSFDDEWKQATERLTREEVRLQAQAMQVIKPYFTSIRKFASDVEKAPSVAAYVGGAKTGLHQNIRGLNAALDRSGRTDWIDWKEKNWKPLSQDSFRPSSDQDVVPKVKQVLRTLDKLEQLVG